METRNYNSAKTRHLNCEIWPLEKGFQSNFYVSIISVSSFSALEFSQLLCGPTVYIVSDWLLLVVSLKVKFKLGNVKNSKAVSFKQSSGK